MQNMDYIYCKYCGKQIDGDSNFCSFCGKKQSPTTASSSKIEDENPTYKFSSSDEYLVKDEKIITEKSVSSEDQMNIRIPRKEKEAANFGILLGIIWLIILLLYSNGVFGDSSGTYGSLIIFSMLIRILVTLWINGIAKRKKRNPLLWSLFGFFIPILALIIIGNLTYSKKTIIRMQHSS